MEFSFIQKFTTLQAEEVFLKILLSFLGFQGNGLWNLIEKKLFLKFVKLLELRM